MTQTFCDDRADLSAQDRADARCSRAPEALPSPIRARSRRRRRRQLQTITIEPVALEIAPGKVIKTTGYNGKVPRPWWLQPVDHKRQSMAGYKPVVHRAARQTLQARDEQQQRRPPSGAHAPAHIRSGKNWRQAGLGSDERYVEHAAPLDGGNRLHRQQSRLDFISLSPSGSYGRGIRRTSLHMCRSANTCRYLLMIPAASAALR